MSQAEEELSPLAPHEEAELLAALEAALRPGELAAEVNERLIELALEDPLAPPTEQELVESARLRDALQQGSSHEDVDVLRALRAPFEGANDDARAAERALENALGAAPKRTRSNVVYAVFGTAAAVLAAAAALVLVVGGLSQKGAPAASVADAAALVKPHSTAPLFADRFETGETTARMDLIATSRSRDLRDNRYAAWGVR